MRNRVAAAVIALLVSASAARAGTIAGRVVLVKDGKELADASHVVVWVEGVRAGAASRTAAPGPPAGLMKSSSKRFAPRVIAVPKNAAVEFPNADPIYHNVFSVSGANRFDLGLYRSGASKTKTFGEAGLVRVYCNIHPQMVGFVMVLDSDVFGVTGPDGAFRLDGLAPGNYVVRAWHEEGSEVSQPVTVRAAGETELPLRLDVSGYKPQPHKNKYGKDYKPPAESDDERY